jgi:hypothetical protein
MIEVETGLYHGIKITEEKRQDYEVEDFFN